MKNITRSGRRGFTLVELLVVIAIILLLVSILLPSVARALAISRRAGCQSNLKQVLSAVLAYSQDARMHRGTANGMLPAVDVTEGNWKDLEDGNAACLWVLIEYKRTGRGVFRCPGSDKQAPDASDTQFRPETLSYSYISMVDVGDPDSPAGRTSVETQIASDLVILGDKNPRLEAGAGGPLGDKNQNSPNHGQDGQNVGRMSQTTGWADSPNPDGDDNIFASDGGDDSNGVRDDVNDSYLLP
jgi:prepilin-type N-terminal cleavage/methylation domain-containing protein